jgi:voltage-gated potassium channel
MNKEESPANQTLKEKVYRIIFEAETFWGRFFDEALLILILFSVGLVMLDSIPSINAKHGPLLFLLEVIITLIFLTEYITRIWCSPHPRKYILSFFGIIDLLAVLPLFITFIVPGTGALLTIRALRLLRIYRILKMVKYIYEGKVMLLALQRSFRKILVFMGLILIIVTMLGSMMYVIEGGTNGFNTIPTSIYWAIITLTTVGYGDIVPVTSLGKFVSSAIMLLGYSIIAIPLGMISFEFARPVMQDRPSHAFCVHYEEVSKDPEAKYCKHCGCKILRE